jgi:hypothetical protein
MFEIAYPLYTINFPKHWLVRDEPVNRLYFPATEKCNEEMLFHVRSGDYLTTLASILRFFEETIKDNNITPEMRELQTKKIRELIDNLICLNKSYTIVPRDGEFGV